MFLSICIRSKVIKKEAHLTKMWLVLVSDALLFDSSRSLYSFLSRQHLSTQTCSLKCFLYFRLISTHITNGYSKKERERERKRKNYSLKRKKARWKERNIWKTDFVTSDQLNRHNKIVERTIVEEVSYFLHFFSLPITSWRCRWANGCNIVCLQSSPKYRSILMLCFTFFVHIAFGSRLIACMARNFSEKERKQNDVGKVW